MPYGKRAPYGGLPWRLVEDLKTARVIHERNDLSSAVLKSTVSWSLEVSRDERVIVTAPNVTGKPGSRKKVIQQKSRQVRRVFVVVAGAIKIDLW